VLSARRSDRARVLDRRRARAPVRVHRRCHGSLVLSAILIKEQ
jgi:hypothetical protein